MLSYFQLNAKMPTQCMCESEAILGGNYRFDINIISYQGIYVRLHGISTLHAVHTVSTMVSAALWHSESCLTLLRFNKTLGDLYQGIVYLVIKAFILNTVKSYLFFDQNIIVD